MFNVTVLKMKDIKKYFISTIIFIITIISLTKYFSNIKKDSQVIKQQVEKKVENISGQSLVSCLDKTIPVIANVNEEYSNIAKEDDVKEEKNILQEILKTQISTIKGLEIAETKENSSTKESTIAENTEQVNAEQTEENSEQIQTAQTGLKTEIVTNNPLAENFNTQYGNVKIKNQTSYTLTQEMLTPDITIENKKILLFQTHSCESYTSSEKYPYTPTGNFRTTDLNFTVTRVGTELEKQLKQYNI